MNSITYDHTSGRQVQTSLNLSGAAPTVAVSVCECVSVWVCECVGVSVCNSPGQSINQCFSLDDDQGQPVSLQAAVSTV